MKKKAKKSAKKVKKIKTRYAKQKAKPSKEINMKKAKTNANIRTQAPITWCPGCFNFQILSGVEKFLSNKDKDNFAIVSGIGCHAKIFDYLNLPGLYGLHGRVLPTMLGMKIANPKLNILGFAGDGDAYDEGIAHLIHAARYNSNFTYIVHNNQVFALTVGQPTPTTELGYIDKTTPKGVNLFPINIIKLMLSAGATFVARVFADSEQIKQVLEEAHKHRGFSFIEILQPCIVFHPDKGFKERIYELQRIKYDKSNLKSAIEKAEEFDYNSKTSKIPVGIFYQKENKPVIEEEVRK